MLGEGLRQELPELFGLWARRPQLRVPRMHPALGVLAGLGTQWLALSLMRGVIFLTAYVTRIQPVRTFDLTETLSWAIAAVVAYASGGRHAFWLLAGIAVALEAVTLALGLPGAALFCERSGRPDCANEPLRLALASWPVLVGLGVGILGRRIASSGASGYLALPLGASIVALAYPVTRLASLPFIGPLPGSEMAREHFNWLIGAQIGAAFAMGVIAGRYGRRHVVAAATIAAAYLLTWLPYAQLMLSQRPAGMPFHLESDWQMITPVFFALAALFGLAMGAAARTKAPQDEQQTEG